MRRLTGSALLAVCALALASAAGRGEDKKTGIEGTYLIVGLELNGSDLGEFVTKGKEEDRTMKITATQMIMTKNGKDDPADYKLDPSKNPKEIDLVGKKGAKGKEMDEKMYGIYKIDGDKLVICIAGSEKPEDRPKEFKTSKDEKTLRMMMTLQKKK